MARNKFDVDENLESPFSFAHLKRAMKYVKKHAFKMVLALVLSCIASVVALFGPKIMQWALDDAVPHNDFGLLGRLALFYTLIVIIGIVFTTIRARIMAHVSQEIVYDIREDLFAHLQRLPFSYYDSRPAGKILVRVINYVNSVSDMLSNGIINSILEIVNVAFIIVFMYSTHALLATIVVAGLPLFAAVIWYIKPRQRKYWQAQSNKNSNYNAYLAESIDGVRVSQLFAREEENISIMKRLAAACRAAWLKAVYVGNAVWLSSEIISQIVFTVMYIAGVYWIGGAMVSFGVLLAMGQYVSRFWQPITNLANIYNMFINNIAFRDVTFAYEPGVNILENLSFSVREGESVALVGPTGAGKTTVVNLISRFYNLTGGQVVLDGKYDIAGVTLHSLRSQMGIMLQDSFIFSGTIMDNIRYGRLDATDEEVQAAARAVRAHDFIMEMDRGYYTEVNERGSRLSQGQRQLISFARTLLSDPKILILDEATSSIDTKTERLLQEGIAALLKGRTSFIIAHRLSTIKTCDKIMYIADKHIQECGSHDELIARRGLYYNLYTAQSQEQGVALAT